MAMRVSRYLKDTAIVERSTETQGSGGVAGVGEWSEIGSIACRFEDISQGRADQTQGAQVVTRYILFVPASADILANDRIQNITMPDGTTITGSFLVREVLPRRAIRGRQTHAECELDRIV